MDLVDCPVIGVPSRCRRPLSPYAWPARCRGFAFDAVFFDRGYDRRIFTISSLSHTYTPITDCLGGVALRLGGGTIRLEREEDGQDGSAGKVKLLLQRKALEGVEDVPATVLEVLGEEDAEG
jgi:hypothetical protein